MSETPPNRLYPALLAAMKACGPVKKDASNPAFRTKYATLQSVLETIEQPLWDNGLLIVQRFWNDEAAPILITQIIHAESGENLTSQIPIVCKDPLDPQKMGGAITYYRRYSLLALLGLAPEDDDGNTAAKPAPAAAKPIPSLAPIPPPARQNEAPEAAIAPGDGYRYLEIVRNDESTRTERLDALDRFYALAGDFADFTVRASFVKTSGLPVEDRKAAYEKHQRRLSERDGATTPARPFAGVAG